MYEGVGFIHVADDRDLWWWFVNVEMNQWFPRKENNIFNH